MTISESEKRLFNGWPKERGGFVPDGVVSETAYQTSSPKIALILKEPNGPNGSLREFLPLRKGDYSQMWDNVAMWVHGVRNFPQRFEWSFYEKRIEDFREEALKSIVTMNLKKSPGSSRTVNTVLKAVAKEDAPYIKRQYALYDPDITICGGTGELFYEVVGHNHFCWQETGPIGARKDKISWYRRNADPEKPKYVIDYWHPAYTQYGVMTPEALLYVLLDVIAEMNRSPDG